MKSRILFYSLILLVSSICAMEQLQKADTHIAHKRTARDAERSIEGLRETVGRPRISAEEEDSSAQPAIAVAISTAQKETELVVLPAPLPPLLFASSQRTEGRHVLHAIDPNAIQFSNMLTGMIEFKHHQAEQKPHRIEIERQEQQAHTDKNVVTLDSPDEHITFIAELLNFLAAEQFRTQQGAQYQTIIDFIAEHTRNFTTISFADMYTILDYFDIPIARNALLIIQQPLPLPTNPAQEIAYLEQLSIVFAAARQDFIEEKSAVHNNNKLLWQFFGRMLYPGCFANAKVSEMITFITQHQDIEQLVLGVYMQQYPQLYQHLIKEFSAVVWPTISPDGRIIAIQSGDDLDLINIDDWSIVRTIKNAFRATFSPDGQTIAAYFPDQNVTLINIHDGSPIRTFTEVANIAFSPDGKTIAVYSDRSIKLINISDGSTIQTSTNFLEFSPDGQTIAVPSGRDIKLINISDGSTVQTFTKAYKIRFSHDGQTIAIETKRGIDLINMHDFSIIQTIEHATAPVFSPNGQVLAVTTEFHKINLINVHNGSLATVFANTVRATFSPDGRTVITSQYMISSQLRGYVSLREALLSPLMPPIYIETPTKQDREVSETPAIETEEPTVLPAPLPKK